MRELTRFFNGVLAEALRRELEAVGIASHITTDQENAYLGRMQFVVWADEQADQAAVQRACEAVQAAQAQAGGRQPTRVSVADGTVRCVQCNYDLRGQQKDGNCPECGHPYRIVRVKACANCGAEMPGDFDVCWRCGKESRESPA